MTTTFCRSCGTRIEFNINQLNQSITQTKSEARDLDVLGWGRSAISLCGFAFIVVLIARFAVIPTPPAPDIPRVGDLPLFPSDVTWAGGAAPSAQATPNLDDLTKATDRLHWRSAQAANVLSSFSIDFIKLTEAQDQLLALQKSDGSFPASGSANDLAATGLATLGLQAWPRESRHLEAAQKARDWIESQWSRMSSTNPTAKALAIAALIDAEALTDQRRKQLGVLLVDGSSPLWQAIGVAGMMPDVRPSQFAALSNKLNDPFWAPYFDTLNGKPLTADTPFRLWFSEYANTLATTEQRLAWATMAWFRPRAADDLATCLRTWTAEAKLPVDEGTSTIAGADIAQPALRLLLAGVPLRMPALNFSK